MKSMLSLTAAALLCASASFAQEDAVQGQAGVATVDGGNLSTATTAPAVEADNLFATGSGLSGGAIAGIVAAVVVVGVLASDSGSSNNTTSTTGTN